MKKTIIQKALASLTALLAVSAIALPMTAAAAANTPTINAAPATKLDTPDATVAVPVKKDIVLFNANGSDILSPNINYSYEITAAAVTETTITTYAPEDLDTDGKTPKTGAVPITVTVKPGIINAVTVGNNAADAENKVTGTISFGDANDTNHNNNTDKHESNNENAQTVDLTKKVSSSMSITVDANKIYDTNGDHKQDNGPGVYRYKITDVTEAVTLKESGITRAQGNNQTIYLDVYTKYNADKNGLVVYGYVLLKDTTSHDSTSINYDKTTTEETLKITGFDTESENTNNYGSTEVAPAGLTSDSYHTYNVEVWKKTEGDLADTQHNFPFKIELTNANTVTSLDDFYYVITKDGTAQQEQIRHLSNAGAWTLDGSTDAALQLQNGDKIVITGLPVKTSIKVTETNDTDDKYTVSATKRKETGEETEAIPLKSGESAPGTSLSVASDATAEMNAALELIKKDVNDQIVFTNTLKDISVTGLLFNIAPFAFITAAGAVLFGLFMKNRKYSDTESKI